MLDVLIVGAGSGRFGGRHGAGACGRTRAHRGPQPVPARQTLWRYGQSRYARVAAAAEHGRGDRRMRPARGGHARDGRARRRHRGAVPGRRLRARVTAPSPGLDAVAGCARSRRAIRAGVHRARRDYGRKPRGRRAGQRAAVRRRGSRARDDRGRRTALDARIRAGHGTTPRAAAAMGDGRIRGEHRRGRTASRRRRDARARWPLHRHRARARRPDERVRREAVAARRSRRLPTRREPCSRSWRATPCCATVFPARA